MADATDPVLLVMSGDRKRFLWLNHHVTSHWPNARVAAAPADDPAALAAAVRERDPDAVLLQIDFSSEGTASSGLEYLRQMLRASPGAYGIVLAENGSEISAVRAMKCGARDYLPLGRLTRDSLLRAVGDAHERHRGVRPVQSALPAEPAGPLKIQVPGYAIVKEISTTNFSSVFLARSERLRRDVVLKVMNRGFTARDLDDAERFQREYEIISSLGHRAIAEIYDFGALSEQQYLAMEYIPCGD